MAGSATAEAWPFCADARLGGLDIRLDRLYLERANALRRPAFDTGTQRAMRQRLRNRREDLPDDRHFGANPRVDPVSGLGARALLVGGTLLAAISAGTSAARGCDRSTFRVVLDVGHSAQSPGAISARGDLEFNFNQRLSAAIEARLVASGFTATHRMVSSGPRGDLGSRSARADAMGANLFLSIHHDSVQSRYLETWTHQGRQRSYSDRFKGWSIFVSQANPRALENLAFAQLLADNLLDAGLPFTRHHAEPIPGERRVFLDSRRGIYRHDALGVLKNANAPALLLEAGIIVNRDEEAALDGADRQGRIAQAVAQATAAFCAGRTR